MRISVVINTYNRGPSLRTTLDSLRYQTFPEFEAVVVNGPSTDETAAVLDEFAGVVRVGHCPAAHLSKSRNVGIALAAGDVVAFLDDDAIPEPTWLEELAAAYDSPEVGAAGGLVYDHTGFRLQYRYAACDRTGQPDFRVRPPFDCLTRLGADPFLYLQGTNCSFRRECLAEIGGFDEEIEYYLDEVEVCLQVHDRGHVIRALDGAAVHHKYLASHLRNTAKVVLNPYPLAKNRTYFALLHGRRSRSEREVMRAVGAYAAGLRVECEEHFAAGRMTDAQKREFLERLDRGLADGRRRGLQGRRYRRELPPPDPEQFRPFPALRPDGKRIRACFVGLAPGGLPRPEAVELAARGHEVHAVGIAGGANRVDLESGVWTHRLAEPRRHLPALEGQPERDRLCRAAAVHHEIGRIRARRPLDGVMGAEELAVLEGPTARGAVGLLDPECFPTDYLAEVARLRDLPDPCFLEGAYLILLGREIDAAGRSRFGRLLRGGLTRFEVVRYLAGTQEASEAGIPLSWLEGAEELYRQTRIRAPRWSGNRVRVTLTRLTWAVRRCLKTFSQRKLESRAG